MIRKSLKNQDLKPLYKATMVEEVKVRDWNLSEHVLSVGEQYDVLLEISCADGTHVRLRTPGITAPTWVHKRTIKPETTTLASVVATVEQTVAAAHKEKIRRVVALYTRATSK